MSPSENGAPGWLAAVRKLERAIGVPVERLVTSDAYFDLLPQLKRAQAQLEEMSAAATESWYRLLNVPTGTDMRQMREQLSRLERQVEKLTKQLAARESATRPAPRKRTPTD